LNRAHEGDKMGLIVKKATKQYCAKKGIRCPDRVLVALSTTVERLLTDASERAKGNGRKTLKPTDL
jgi:histone H3/H4